MHAADWHLLLAHVPVFGVIFGLGLLLLGLAQRSQDLPRASLLLFAVAAALAVPTYLTGEPASRHLLQLMPAMPMEAAEQHLEIAMAALVLTLVLGLFSLAIWWRFRGGKPLARWALAGILVLALAGAGLMVWTANLGGKVRHVEIRKTH